MWTFLAGLLVAAGLGAGTWLAYDRLPVDSADGYRVDPPIHVEETASRR